ncbi:hypothetical protein H2200_001112 [Cladophialophora chaetospira]|uniref:FAS1 domain-containing protein n=1 Tax=Cladophialophora chaetospira TaxID=386627 RepID=A0AA39CMR6_9EURO|nr:hypothetical protein H2200_001112 [Cladophialophora chaetospira]
MLALFSASLLCLRLCLSQELNLNETYNLTTVLSGQAQLSKFTSYLNAFPALLSTLSEANVTILAPSNNAWAKYTGNDGHFANDTNFLEALLSYHTVQGVYPLTRLQQDVQFLPTLLGKGEYANVTGGQRVGVYPSGQDVNFETGVKSQSKLSTPDIPYTHDTSVVGIVHIIDEVFRIPIVEIPTATEAQLNDVVSLQLVQPVDQRLVGFLGPEADWTLLAPKHSKGVLPTTDEESFGIQEYHFIKGQVLFSYNFTDRREVTTLNGKNLTFYVAPNGTRYVNDAPIVDSDYLIDTGVFHVIETALDPRIPNAKPNFLTVANATTTTGPSPTGLPISSSSAAAGKSGLTTGAKAGIGVGVTLGVLMLLGVGAFFLLRRRRQQTANVSHAKGKPGWAEIHQLSDDKAPREMQGESSLHEIHSEGTSGLGEMEGSQGARSRRAGERGQLYEMQ